MHVFSLSVFCISVLFMLVFEYFNSMIFNICAHVAYVWHV